ncbi:MAG: hypothetical protein ACHQY2_00535 [Candidatus Eremiobacterales bacterium]
MMVTAATLAAVVVSAGTAMAMPVAPRPVASPPPQVQKRNQQQSNESIRLARRHIEIAIDGLQHDASDYGGHKESARDDLGVARQFLDQALGARGGRNGGGNGSPVPVTLTNTAVNPVPVVPSNGGNGNGDNNDNRNQRGSTQNIMNIRSHVEAAIDALNQDRTDYGGYKARAMEKLQQARQELDAAVDFIHNPGVRNGGTGEGVSNSNLRFVNEHVNTAISNLQSDNNDYGGHRVTAINDLQTANSDIAQALAFDKAHPGTARVQNTAPVAPVSPVTMGNTSTGHAGQHQSNQSLVNARQNLEQAIDSLSRDAHDYGGFRVKAMEAMQSARTQIDQALQFQR